MHTLTLRTLLTLPLLFALASPALAEDDKALLAKCDFDRNGTINGGGNDHSPAAWTMIEKERVCMHEYELDQLAKFMPDIRQRCDLNGNGRIDHAEPLITPLMVSGKETNGRKAYRSLPEDVRKQVDAEQKCVQEAELAKGKAELAKGKEELAKGKAELAKGKAELAKGKEELAKMDEILALLNPAEAKAVLAQDIRNTAQLLQQARERKDQGAVQRYESRLRELKERQNARK